MAHLNKNIKKINILFYFASIIFNFILKRINEITITPLYIIIFT